MMQKHFKFYKRCMLTGYLPNNGLCNCADNGDISNDLLDLFVPTIEDFKKLVRNRMPTVYWACGISFDELHQFNHAIKFTELRQNIILFMACMAGEKF